MFGAEEAELVLRRARSENEAERGGIRTRPALSAARLAVVDAILDAMVHDYTPVGGDEFCGTSSRSRRR